MVFQLQLPNGAIFKDTDEPEKFENLQLWRQNKYTSFLEANCNRTQKSNQFDLVFGVDSVEPLSYLEPQTGHVPHSTFPAAKFRHCLQSHNLVKTN